MSDQTFHQSILIISAASYKTVTESFRPQTSEAVTWPDRIPLC